MFFALAADEGRSELAVAYLFGVGIPFETVEEGWVDLHGAIDLNLSVVGVDERIQLILTYRTTVTLVYQKEESLK